MVFVVRKTILYLCIWNWSSSSVTLNERRQKAALFCSLGFFFFLFNQGKKFYKWRNKEGHSDNITDGQAQEGMSSSIMFDIINTNRIWIIKNNIKIISVGTNKWHEILQFILYLQGFHNHENNSVYILAGGGCPWGYWTRGSHLTFYPCAFMNDLDLLLFFREGWRSLLITFWNINGQTSILLAGKKWKLQQNVRAPLTELWNTTRAKSHTGKNVPFGGFVNQ